MLNDIPVYWRSAKQCSTATSAAEAEVYALFEAVKAANLYWWRADQFGMQLPRPMTIWVDNRQAESLANNTCLNSKLGGVFDMRDSRIKEIRDKGAVEIKWVRRDYNPADILTHCMPSGSFNRMVRAINSQLRFSRDHTGQGGV
jgi:hypothetical protein